MWRAGKINLPEGRLYSEELTSYLGTQAELIESPTIRQRALERVLARFPELTSPIVTNRNPETLPFDIKVKTSLKSSTLKLHATGPTQESTRVFLDELMEAYLSFKREARTRTSSSALASITEQIREVEEQLQERQKQLAAFEASNNVSFLNERSLSAGSHLAKLDQSLSDLRTELRLLNSLSPEQFLDMAVSPGSPSTGVAVPGEEAAQALALSAAAPRSAYFQALQQLELLKAERDEFTQVLRPAHSKMIKLNQEILGLEKLLNAVRDEEEHQALAQLVNRKKSLELQIQNLESQYSSWETNAVDASRQLAEYQLINRQMERHQALYDRLVSLVQTVDLNQALDQESLSPLAPASAARPSLTRYKIAIAGLFLGLMAGGGLLLVLAVVDDRFTSLTEMRLQLSEDIVGQIPESILARRNGKARHGSHPEDQQAFTESFRSLRSSLICMADHNDQPKVFLVTSSVPKEGKTTVTANFAAVLAMSGARVLVIDADLRRSSLHKVFGAESKPGLCEVLHEGVSVGEAIVSTQQPNLDLLPAGGSSISSSEAFLGQRADQLLRELAAKYDYVLVDTAPVLATDDVATLGSRTDGVFMVVRASYTSARMTREALERLHRRRINVLGVIYNRAEPSSDYCYRYSSDYHDRKAANSLPVMATPLKAH
jgi:capsular exopolysaccharide synthesis family protein